MPTLEAAWDTRFLRIWTAPSPAGSVQDGEDRRRHGARPVELPVQQALAWLAKWPADRSGVARIPWTPPGGATVQAVAGPSVRYWAEVARFALELAAAQQFVPYLTATGEARWYPARFSPDQVRRVRAFAAAMPPECRSAAPSTPAAELLLDFLSAALDATVRQALAAAAPERADLGGFQPARSPSRRLAQRAADDEAVREWVAALTRSAEPPSSENGKARSRLRRDRQDGAARQRLRSALHAWLRPLFEEPEAEFRTCFRLVPPGTPSTPGGPETSGDVPSPAGGEPACGDQPWLVQFVLQAKDDPSLLVEAPRVWQERSSTLAYLRRRWRNPQERLLADLGRASRLFPPLQRSLQEPRPTGCPLSTDEAYRFLREWAPALEQAGFGVLIPGWWRKPERPALRLTARSAAGPSASRSAGLGREGLVQFHWEVALGGQVIPADEFRRLARLKLPLVQVRGQWVELDPAQVQQTLQMLERHAVREGTVADLARIFLSGSVPSGSVEGPASYAPGDGAGAIEVRSIRADPALTKVLERLRALAGHGNGGTAGQGGVQSNGRGARQGTADGAALPAVPQPAAFAGQLRPYQLQGLAWLWWLDSAGLGACLADDMGLGKTVQIIALLLHERQEQAAGDGAGPARVGPTLIVCPMSVVGNWQREIERFGPTLRVLVHHGPQRLTGRRFARAAAASDVVITTYGLVHRDLEALQAVRWHRVVLDEAQNIKNPSARQSQAARALPAARRIALTGTPIENRLSELWSIMHFLNPGYLGSAQGFHRRFAIPIERYGDERQAAVLRHLVRPFVLRRLKTDPRVVQDLPEKMEMKVFCPLTPEQATLYQAVVDDLMQELESIEGTPAQPPGDDGAGETGGGQPGEAAGAPPGIRRRGVVLAALTKLKQICDHPALFLQDDSALEGHNGEARSGKLARLAEMLDELLAAGDRALVFTQFASMGSLLERYLPARLGQPVLFLHGGTPKRKRDELVAAFQGGEAPVLVASLKAGGVGLNLTAANHVFHFDRWWNPAVEDQATDRAFRIGQRRNVQVHKFICQGTLEERIDQLMERKRGLADRIVGAGEQWLTELTNAQLRELLRLSADAIGGDERD
ncbi:DEAD/DEAH box helicase [Carboxydochorda subterranea]|uniref:DEAD/DEAH box helicase n=1 Tax=Carboxydichorda subterranea TaxID=3109565 RepID=A0ABZ1C1T6_9FIRM|nr:DEAD/DEAH box helicase [Limnochorda sp. L945t]WRP18795.1 DEAD/DEAH box helicase [Limnochorda sp. L945t]